MSGIPVVPILGFPNPGEAWLVDAQMLLSSENPRSHAVIKGITGDDGDDLFAPRWCYTVGGRKVHLLSLDQRTTVCGFVAWQICLESDDPGPALCDWCRAHLQKENRGS